MADLLARVIVGNIVLNPCVLREFLKKSHYFMSYEPETEIIQFQVNDGDGGKTIMEIRNASYENAVKLAEGLGLSSDTKEPTIFWSKYNPVSLLYHDGSEDAEKIRMESLRLDLPCRVRKIDGTPWRWHNRQFMYQPPNWNLEGVLNEIRREADVCKKFLETTP